MWKTHEFCSTQNILYKKEGRPIRDAIYRHREMYNGVNRPVPFKPDDPRSARYFLKWMKKFEKHVNYHKRDDGSIDYALSATRFRFEKF